MTTVQRAAQVFGWGFIAFAILGFVASGGSMEADPEMAPKLLGLFPVNVLHNLVHAAFGVWGIMAARSFSAAKSYATIAGVIYLVLAALGFVFPTTFGLIPIGGNDIWLHVVLGLLLVSIGFTASGEGARVAEEPRSEAAPGTTTTPPAEAATDLSNPAPSDRADAAEPAPPVPPPAPPTTPAEPTEMPSGPPRSPEPPEREEPGEGTTQAPPPPRPPSNPGGEPDRTP